MVYHIYYLLLKLCLLFLFYIVIWWTISCKLFADLIWNLKFGLTFVPVIIKFSQVSIFVFLIIDWAFTLNSFPWVSLFNKFHIIKMSCILFCIIIFIYVTSSCKSMDIGHFHFKRGSRPTESKRFLIYWLCDTYHLLCRCRDLMGIKQIDVIWQKFVLLFWSRLLLTHICFTHSFSSH